MPVDMEKRTIDKENRFYKLCAESYRSLVSLILDVELKRGDTATVFSEVISRIYRVEGIPRLMEILRAMGKDPLDRNTYYSYVGGTSKKECLSHLLKVSYPVAEGSLLAGTGGRPSGRGRRSIDCSGVEVKGAPVAETAADLKKAVKAGKVSDDRLIGKWPCTRRSGCSSSEEVLGIDGFTERLLLFHGPHERALR